MVFNRGSLLGSCSYLLRTLCFPLAYASPFTQFVLGLSELALSGLGFSGLALSGLGLQGFLGAPRSGAVGTRRRPASAQYFSWHHGPSRFLGRHRLSIPHAHLSGTEQKRFAPIGTCRAEDRSPSRVERLANQRTVPLLEWSVSLFIAKLRPAPQKHAAPNTVTWCASPHGRVRLNN